MAILLFKFVMREIWGHLTCHCISSKVTTSEFIQPEFDVLDRVERCLIDRKAKG